MNWKETQHAIADHLEYLAQSTEVLQEACRAMHCAMPDVVTLGDYVLVGHSIGGAPSGWYWPNTVHGTTDWLSLHYRRGGSVIVESALPLRSVQLAATLTITLLYEQKPDVALASFQQRCRELGRECRRQARSVRAPQLALELEAA